ncbi:hypothetical protein BWQ96_08529 [Gracilariopsis chorda]|uniref:Secreted protein n=1 Tax=Gracilariopsis chorda TaxID=448386 RepID=A0A2V3IKT2_9FLOR|nr:hypothetical protein BWQ96_08529 [Gracilariopsis chorda]|eukprot:PXF41740.1 hypothetical protein BWQ96_08529 [Gracilariopsis chorda]
MHRGMGLLRAAMWAPCAAIVAPLSSVASCDSPSNPPPMVPPTVLRSVPSKRSSASQPSEASPHPLSAATLHRYYAAFPDPLVSADLTHMRQPLNDLTSRITDGLEPRLKHVLHDIHTQHVPSSLDNAMYCIRCACEEASCKLRDTSKLHAMARRLDSIATRFETFQAAQREHVSRVISGFLPSDFRGSLFSVFRQRSERVNRQAVQDLMNNGGTIRQKYDLLWQQQWKRRENLAMIGNATGVWRWLFRYLAGVPDHLLTFARHINSPNGPTESLRVKFAPALHQLARCAIDIHVLCAALTHVNDELHLHRATAVIDACLTQYERDVDKFVLLLEQVIVNSPFFVHPADIPNLRTDDNDAEQPQDAS